MNGPKPKEPARIEFFSDGVFAIAITLLVLELIQSLHVETGGSLLDTLSSHWQSFLAFFIGFVTILICWINHHVAFEYIHRVDTNLMWINGFLLFLVTLTPLPTAILAEYLEKESHTALAIFGLNYTLMSTAAFSICAYAYRRHLIEEDQRPQFYAYKLIYSYSIIYTIVGFLLCFISIVIPIIWYTILFVLFAAPKKFAMGLYQFRSSRKNKMQMKSAKVQGQ